MAKRKREATADEIIRSFADDERALALYLRDDPVAFAKHVCGITPHPAQVEFLKLPIEDNYHVMLPWARQTGKSKICSVFIAHRLFSRKGYRAFLFSPSEDQSRQAIWSDVVKYFKTNDFLAARMESEVRGDTLYVGGDKWGAQFELVKIGFEGKLGRGRSTNGNGVIIFEELGVMNAADVCKGNLSPITRSGGGEIILSSPSDPGGTLHQIYSYWKSAETENPRFRVIECDWTQTTHCTKEWVEEL